MNPLQIRRYRPSDVDAIYSAVMESRRELSTWMPWCHASYCRQDAINWVESRPDAWENNREWSFVIVDSGDRFLGTCGIHRIEALNGVAEIGYWVRSTATCRGVATSATQQLCHWAFSEARLHRIEVLASVENLPSQRVAEKIGAVREGILIQRMVLHGRRHDCVLFAILNESDVLKSRQ